MGLRSGLLLLFYQRPTSYSLYEQLSRFDKHEVLRFKWTYWWDRFDIWTTAVFSAADQLLTVRATITF